jgi:hypothetical protein
MSLPRSEKPYETLRRYIEEYWSNTFACTVQIGFKLDNYDQFYIVHSVLYPEIAVNLPSEFEGMKVVIEKGTK